MSEINFVTPYYLTEILALFLPYELAIKIVYEYKGYITPSAKVMNNIIQSIYDFEKNTYKKILFSIKPIKTVCYLNYVSYLPPVTKSFLYYGMYYRARASDLDLDKHFPGYRNCLSLLQSEFYYPHYRKIKFTN